MTEHWTSLTREQKGALIRPYIEIEHKSYAQIAAILGVSRVAIAGAADRNKIKSPFAKSGATRGQAGAQAKHRRAAADKSVKAKRPDKPGPVPKPAPRPKQFVENGLPVDGKPIDHANWTTLPDTDPRPVEDHREDQCRWPVDTPYGTWFCCAPVLANKHYCAVHHERGTRPAPPIRLRKGTKTKTHWQ